MPRDFDIILHGATGYTGRLVAEVLKDRAAAEGLRWAISGRDHAKLHRVSDELGLAGVATLVADADDAASIEALAGRTRLIISTVGPYQLYGGRLIAACASAGTDYVDLCGEPAWMAAMIERHQAGAEASGARITFSCGFDSIPFDLGVRFLEEEAERRFGAPATRVRGRVRKMRGGFSGGTAASLGATMAAAKSDPTVLARMIDPFALTPGFEGPQQPDDRAPYRDEVAESWVTPFVMAAINTKNIHRTNQLLGHRYGADFRYDEMLMTGDGEAGRQAAEAAAQVKGLGGKPLQPGEGPTPEERAAGFYDILFIGDTEGGDRLRASVSGDLDPGYGSTSRMLAEAAICLLKDGTAGGGIWTAGAAMGPALIRRLQEHAGLTFRLED